MLASIGSSPVNTLDGALAPDVLTARNTLRRISKAVQGESWEFNTEACYPLQRDADNFIPLPANTIVVRVTYPVTVDAVQRGLRLYDKKNHTYVFDQDVKATIVFALPFEELPEQARQYIFVRASREFQQGQVSSEILTRFEQIDEARARADMIRAEGGGNLLDRRGSYRPSHVVRSDK